MRVLLLSVTLGFGGVVFLQGAPKLESIFPSGGQRGQKVEVELSGTFENDISLWFSVKGITFVQDPEEKKKGTIQISKEAKPGAVLLRALADDGASAPLVFVVGDSVEISEKEEDESRIVAGQSIGWDSPLLTINGKIEKNDEIDSYSVTLRKGETLHAAVLGYRLRSLIDPVLHLYDKAGNRLALSHDSANHLDPRLGFEAPESGEYFVAVTGFSHPPAASVQFRGSKTANYRLYLSKDSAALPEFTVPKPLPEDSESIALVPDLDFVGTLEDSGEADVYTLESQKDDLWLVRVESNALGYPMDPVLDIFRSNGELHKSFDDADKKPDVNSLWRAPEDGLFRFEVRDRFGSGGEAFRYRLHFTEPIADFAVTCDKTAYLVEAGATLDLKLNVKRINGHKADLRFFAKDLPESITLVPTGKVPEKGGEITLKCKVSESAKAFSAPIALYAEAKTGAKKQNRVVFSYEDANYRGPYLINEIEDIWLTIKPPPPPSKPKEKEAAKEE